MHPTPHLAPNIYEPSNANKVSMELDFFLRMLSLFEPLAFLTLIPRFSYLKVKYWAWGKDETEAESMPPQLSVSCSRPGLCPSSL